jgi:hypothetical protein
MNLHLAEIAAAVEPAAHAVLLVDQAGWHMSTRLVVPANVTIITLPPKCPELNPVENVWQFMRDNWLSNRIFKRLTTDTGKGLVGTVRGWRSGCKKYGPTDCRRARSGDRLCGGGFPVISSTTFWSKSCSRRLHQADAEPMV